MHISIGATNLDKEQAKDDQGTDTLGLEITLHISIIYTSWKPKHNLLHLLLAA